MKSESKNYDLIEKYLTRKMSDQEKTAFEEKAKTDTEFAEEVIAHTLAKQEIEAAAMNDLKAKINKGYDQARKTDVISMRQTRRQWFSVAAAVLVLIVCIPLLRNILAPPAWNANEIYTQNFEPAEFRNLESTRSVDNKRSPEEEHRKQMSSIWDSALTSINKEDYATAISHYETLMQDSLTMNHAGSTIRFQTGVAWLLNNDPQKAIEYFKQVKRISTFGRSAVWYTGMAYLKMDNREKVKEVFTQISTGEGFKPEQKEKANAILKRLEDSE